MSKEETSSLKIKADAYLRKHRIIELFEDLSTQLCYKQPQNVNEFIIDQLKKQKDHGFKTGLFTSEEIKNIFVLFDLKRDGYIAKEQCIEALKTIANSDFQISKIEKGGNIPDQVDQYKFQQLCEQILGQK